MNHNINNLANAIDNYNLALDAWNHCLPDQEGRYRAIRESAERKYRQALERVVAGYE